MSSKKWKYAVGEKGGMVTVYEREVGGLLYARAFDPSLRSGKGGYRCLSLGHRDKDRAKAYALDQAAKLQKGRDDITLGRITLGQLFALYRKDRTPRKTPGVQKSDERQIEMWTRFLGAGKDTNTIALREWEAFVDARKSGAIDPRGKPVQEGERRPVRARCLEIDLKWFKAVLNWGMKWRTKEGRYLLNENPVRGYEIPTERNPRRPVVSEGRYEATSEVSGQVTMEIRWTGKRISQRSYLSELLDIVNGTGRRISAVCALTYEDLRLNDGPYGSIRWPADTDKMGHESTVPISPSVRAALDRIHAERPGIGAAPLFPSPGDPTEPMTRHLADKWLRKAEKLAGLESQVVSLWHAYRRKWGSERKHLPDVDVAAAGGWKDTVSLKRAYQQADADTILSVVLNGGELREERA